MRNKIARKKKQRLIQPIRFSAEPLRLLLNLEHEIHNRVQAHAIPRRTRSAQLGCHFQATALSKQAVRWKANSGSGQSLCFWRSPPAVLPHSGTPSANADCVPRPKYAARKDLPARSGWRSATAAIRPYFADQRGRRFADSLRPSDSGPTGKLPARLHKELPGCQDRSCRTTWN